MKHQKLKDKIDKTREDLGNSDYKQKTVSGGIIGHSCDAHLWYAFRHCYNKNNTFSAKTLNLFDDGHRSEDVIAARWKDAGVQLQTHDYETKDQITVTSLGGWFKGKLDGIIHGGIPGDEQGTYVWEAKCTAKFPTKKQQEDEYNCIKQWNKKYYFQAQSYMGMTGVHKHITSIASPGARDEIIIETPFSEDDFQWSQNRAERIITSDKALDKVSDRPDYWECLNCSTYDVCKTNYIPEPSCRNCAYVTFHTDGNQRASCAKHGSDFPDVKSMEAFYPCHRFNPDLMLGDAITRDEKGSVIYRLEDGNEYVNGEGQGEFDSMELHLTGGNGLLQDDVFVQIKKEFGGKVVDPSRIIK